MTAPSSRHQRRPTTFIFIHVRVVPVPTYITVAESVPVPGTGIYFVLPAPLLRLKKAGLGQKNFNFRTGFHAKSIYTKPCLESAELLIS